MLLSQGGIPPQVGQQSTAKKVDLPYLNSLSSEYKQKGDMRSIRTSIVSLITMISRQVTQSLEIQVSISATTNLILVGWSIT